ncbi:UDP-N-acetylmuramate dehydrogenase [Alteromonas pelagimontana]|uniref:UDP-N-acetylenolpyruvoylglucosamine reductase n=1 Tax=Alteromonas pelagimontana TaxID=1858656 RepID=A0A6M4MEL5_9ALTE|nr:UDP-N-acetylmuramate dehydrogenase [Alteromonas pelagimontana]QJR81539.1 UDP-N-acetylmuramate dehydrogenase [Alteromonas pelagimontana]
MPSLQSYHTFGLPSQCQQLTFFNTADEFLDALSSASHNYLLGEGSNTLFLEDFDGQVLVNRIAGITHHETTDAHHLRVGGGENWHQLVVKTMENGWWGMENLALIPGSVGACPIQNIGAYGIEVGQFISSVEVIYIQSGEKAVIDAKDCLFGYRDSVFKHALAGKVLITYVNFTLPKNSERITTYGELAALENPTAKDIFDAVITIRKAKLPDPAILGNAGSFFKNPVVEIALYQRIQAQYPNVPAYDIDAEHKKIPAAWLIDTLGYKGKQWQGVRCHPTQPLVLTNLGSAKGEDVVTLASDIITAVHQTFGIPLEPEVRLVGKTGLVTL